jgi:hypothetical protein
MTTRRAACSCGQLHLTIEGEPLRISMCHCLECQRRTGAVISNQARFRRDQVTFAGQATTWMRTAESGNALTFHFCPTCGSTVYWEGEGFPGYVAVAIGNFADPNFPAPSIAVWEETRHPWVSLPADTWRSRGDQTRGCLPTIRGTKASAPRLIRDVLAAELDGAVEREYGSDGLQCTLCTPTRLCSSTEPQNQAQAAFDLTRQS